MQHIGREERWEHRPKADIPNAQMQQRQENAHGLLPVPGEHHGKRQIIDAAAKGIRQCQCDLNGAVSIIALSNVHQPGQSGINRFFSSCTRLICFWIVSSLKLTLVTVVNSPSTISRHVSSVGQRTTRAKLMSYFSAEAQRHGSYEFDISFSRQRLADYLAVERSGLSLELKKMRENGMIDFHKNHFVLNVSP